MFIIVLHQYHRESEDKWKRLSRQIIDLLLPMLAKQQVPDCFVTNLCSTNDNSLVETFFLWAKTYRI